MYKKIQITLIFLFCCSIVSARYNVPMYRNVHYFSVSGGLGYSTLLENIPELSTMGGVGGTFSFGYELRASQFWLNIAAEAQYIQSTSLYNISGFDKSTYDTQGKQLLYHYEFDDALDNQQFVFVNIPILIGWHYVGFYVGAGMKFGYCLSAKEKATIQYSTTGSYSQYIDDFTQMSDHFYSTYTTSNTADLKSKFKMSIVGEIGYDVLAWARQANRTEHHGLKIGAYIEYGLNNIVQTSGEHALLSIDDKNASVLSVTPFYDAHSTSAYRIVPLYAGIRVSWIFCIRTKHCDCNVAENHKAYYKRYNNILH